MKVITDIQPMIVSESIPQAEINASFAWLMSYLENTDEGIANLHGTEAAFKTRMDAINNYGVSETYINQRRWYTFPTTMLTDEATEGPLLYPDFPEPRAMTMADRMELYKKVVAKVIQD